MGSRRDPCGIGMVSTLTVVENTQTYTDDKIVWKLTHAHIYIQIKK